ncbi:MAG: helicase-related protein, partial [Burkholderiales bacterium]
MVEAAAKRAFLIDLLADPALARVMVFTRTKHGANRVAEQLAKAGIAAEAIHGNKSQGARQRALERFRTGDARVLVATDIAARGIDVDDVTHVINYEIPNIPESYVHRIGRTARAGASGIAISLCDPNERAYLRDIEKLTARRLTGIEGEPVGTAAPAPRNAGRPAIPARRRRRWSRPQHQRRRAA